MVNRRILDPIIRESCALGKGYDSHIRRFEKPCNNCLEVYNEKNRIRYQNNIIKERERSKKYRENNLEKEIKRRKEYYIKNKEIIKEKRDKYRKENPESIKNFNNARRAHKKGSKHEKYSIDEILTLYGNNCYICDLPIDLEKPRKVGVFGWEEGLHIDHVIPISKGGDDTIDNVRPTHGKCNISKGSSLI